MVIFGVVAIDVVDRRATWVPRSEVFMYLEDCLSSPHLCSGSYNKSGDASPRRRTPVCRGSCSLAITRCYFIRVRMHAPSLETLAVSWSVFESVLGLSPLYGWGVVRDQMFAGTSPAR